MLMNCWLLHSTAPLTFSTRSPLVTLCHSSHLTSLHYLHSFLYLTRHRTSSQQKPERWAQRAMLRMSLPNIDSDWPVFHLSLHLQLSAPPIGVLWCLHGIGRSDIVCFRSSFFVDLWTYGSEKKKNKIVPLLKHVEQATKRCVKDDSNCTSTTHGTSWHLLVIDSNVPGPSVSFSNIQKLQEITKVHHEAEKAKQTDIK